MKKVGKYILKESIGTGAYGSVFKATTSTGEEFAVKVIPKKGMTRKALKYLESEARILDKLAPLQNENIVRLVDKKESEHNYYMVFEYCNGGDLRELLRTNNGKLSEESARDIIRQLVSALKLLYDERIIHRDLKLGNVFVHYNTDTTRNSTKPTIKLGDFGFATELPNNNNDKPLCDQYFARSIVGTALTMSPEVMHQQPYSFKSDIWSLGIILYELITGQFCFKGENKAELMEDVQNGVFEIPEGVSLSVECLEFLNECLQYDPKNRISWEQLIRHRFISLSPSTPFCEDAFRKSNPSVPRRTVSGAFPMSNKVKYAFTAPQPSKKNKQINKRRKKMRQLSRKYSNRKNMWSERDQPKSPHSVKKNVILPCTPNRKNNRR